MAQQVRASLPGLSCAERPVFEPRLDHDLFIILPRYVSVRSLNLSISPPHRLHGDEQNKVKKDLQPLNKINISALTRLLMT